MGGSHAKSSKHNLKYIAHLEQSYSCYANSDVSTKLELRKLLIEACSEGNLDDVTNLLQLGVPVDSSVTYMQCLRYSREEKEMNSLFALIPEKVESNYQYASLASLNLRQKKLKVLDVLIENGIDLNLKDRSGQTVLHKLCVIALSVDFNLFKQFVQLGCDINSVDYDGNSLLHCCCLEEKLYNKKNILKYLLENGLDPNSQNSSGDTPVHLSANCSNDAHIKLLIDHRADVNLQNFTEWKTPLHIAVVASHSIGECGGPLDTSRGRTTITTLLKHNADVNLLDYRSISPFGEALGQNMILPYTHSELCQEFINRGADLNACNINRDTLLHLCYSKYLRDMEYKQDFGPLRLHADVEKYVNLGASVNMKNNTNYFPVEYCIHFIPLNNSYTPAIQEKIPFLFKSLKYNINAGLNVRNLCSLNITKLQKIHSLVQSHEEEDSLWVELVNIMDMCGMNLDENQQMPILSLKRLCANVVRVSLKPNAIIGLSKLELPVALRSYISMQ